MLDFLKEFLPLFIEVLPIIIDCFDTMPPNKRDRILTRIQENPKLTAKLGAILLETEEFGTNESREKLIEALEMIANGQ